MSETVTVRRGGSYLTISAEAVDRYVAKGYDVVNEQDKVLRGSIPNDVNALKIAYSKHVAEIEKLKKEIEELKNPKKEEIKPAEKVEDPIEEPVIEIKKSTSRRSRKSE